MALQKKVGVAAAIGVAGDKATPDQSVYTPINYTAGKDGVAAGGFCWDDKDGKTVSSKTSEDAAPLGFVERNLSYPAYNVREDGTLVIPAGQTPNIAVCGDYFVVLGSEGTEAKVGGMVYVQKKDGVVSAKKEAANVVATGWQFATAGKVGDTVIITRWNDPTPAKVSE